MISEQPCAVPRGDAKPPATMGFCVQQPVYDGCQCICSGYFPPMSHIPPFSTLRSVSSDDTNGPVVGMFFIRFNLCIWKAHKRFAVVEPPVSVSFL